MELFKLFGSIFIDNDEANKSLAKTEKQADGVGGKFGKMAGAVGKGALVLGAGAVAAGGALMGVVSKSAEVADGVDKMSSKIGISKKGYQEWGYVMGQNGMDVDKLQVGVKTLTAKMDSANQGNEKAAAGFATLGVSVTDSNGKLKDQETMMSEVIMKLAEMPEGTEKARLATEMFGKAGSEMAPMLATGAAGITDLKDKSHELGLVMSDEAVNSGVAFGDTMDDVKASLGMVVSKVGIELMPVVMKLLEWVLANMPTIQHVFSVVMGAVQVAVKWVIDAFNLYLLPAIKTIYNWVQSNMPTIKAVISGVFDTVSAVVKVAVAVFRDVLMPIFSTLFNWVQSNMPTIKATISGVFTKIKEVWDTVLKPALAQLMAFVRDTLVPKIQELFPKIQKAVEAVFGAIKVVWNDILKPVLDAVWKFIEKNLAPAFKVVFGGIKIAVENAFDAVGIAIDNVTGVFNGVKTTIDNVKGWFTGLKDGISGAINGARDAVDLAIQKIKGFFGFQFKWPALKMPSFSISGSMNPLNWLKDGVPKLSVNWNKEGGIFDKPTIFNTANGLQGVGEAGAEAIMPLSKLQDMLDFNSDRDILQRILKVLEATSNKSTQIVLDGDKLVGGIYDRIDQTTGFKSREMSKAYGG